MPNKPSCPGGIVARAGGTTCAEGYKDPLCGQCDEGFTLRSDGACEPCGATSTFSAAFVSITVLVLLAIFAKTAPFWYRYMSMLEDVVQLARSLELKTVAKMLVANMQILSNLPSVLSIRMPEVFATFIASFVSLFK